MTDMTELERMLYGDVENDADLEAELLALQDDDSDEEPAPPPPPTSNKSSAVPSQPRKGSSSGIQGRAPPPVPSRPAPRANFGEIDRLARQISQEAVIQDDDNDDSVDNDTDLLGELDGILSDDDSNQKISSGSQLTVKPPVPTRIRDASPGGAASVGGSSGLASLLQERLQTYKAAEKCAKEAGEGAKQRRLNRGIKTLEGQLRLAKAGKPVSQDEIPPQIAIGQKHADDSAAQPITSVPESSGANQPGAAPPLAPPKPRASPPETMPKPKLAAEIKPVLPRIPVQVPVSTPKKDPTMNLLERRRDAYKQAAIKAKTGADKMLALKYLKVSKQFDQVIEAMQNEEEVDLSDIPPTPPSSPPADPKPRTLPPAAVLELPTDPVNQPKKELAKPPPPPKSVLEALTQRLEKYKLSAEEAEKEGNSRKARQMGRIQKQYEAAIRAHKAGKPVEFEELPTPPGFGPIPVSGGAGTPVAPKVPERAPQVAEAEKSPAAANNGAGVRRPAPSPGASSTSSGGPSPPKQSRQEQQLQFLIQRQIQFKTAAIAAKKKGDMVSAKKYLKQAKGFDQMIEASRAGIAVDITKTPVPPQAVASRAALKPQVSVTETGEETGDAEGWTMVQGGRDEIFATLEKDLIRQIQICQQNQEYFTRLGDIRRVNQFEKLGTSCKKDLVTLRHAFKLGDPAPRFRYEVRTFPSLQSCPDLGEDDLEIGIVRGLQVKLPSGYEDKDAEIFVRFEFPYPQETPQTGKTHTIKATASPAFNEKHKMKINRKARQFQRLVKRHGIKVEVFQKGGFMRSDRSLGQCEIKLSPLETKAEIHESLDLLEGRKPCGGKIEVRVRVRDPFVDKQAEEVNEKWLVIDEFLRSSALGRKTQQATANQQEGRGQMPVQRTNRRAATPERKAAGEERHLEATREDKPQGRVVYGLPKIQI